MVSYESLCAGRFQDVRSTVYIFEHISSFEDYALFRVSLIVMVSGVAQCTGRYLVVPERLRKQVRNYTL